MSFTFTRTGHAASDIILSGMAAQLPRKPAAAALIEIRDARDDIQLGVIRGTWRDVEAARRFILVLESWESQLRQMRIAA